MTEPWRPENPHKDKRGHQAQSEAWEAGADAMLEAILSQPKIVFGGDEYATIDPDIYIKPGTYYLIPDEEVKDER